MKPYRLFWKLFLAFWLATNMSFTVVIAVFEYKERSGPDSGGWHRTVLYETVGAMIESQGVTTVLPVIDFANRSNAQLNLREMGPTETVDLGDDGRRRIVTSPDGTRYLLESRQAIWRQPNHRVPFAVGTLVSILFSGLLAWNLSRPLRRMADAARDMASGRFSTRVAPFMRGRRDEIGDLAGEFDSMAAQLEQMIGAQRRLLHDISHELRSPLTRLRAAVGLVRQSPEQRANMLARIEQECERLNELIEELLTLARLESGPHNLPYERVDLIELLGAIAEDANFEAGTKDCRVNLVADAAFVSWVSGEMLYRAFENIVRNAVKYTDPGSEVRIEAKVRNDHLHLTVNDDGPGVPDEMLDSIFEPFKRLEGAESYPGLGLGLSIAQRAVQMHGGTITARPGQPRGLSIQVVLPRRNG